MFLARPRAVRRDRRHAVGNLKVAGSGGQTWSSSGSTRWSRRAATVHRAVTPGFGQSSPVPVPAGGDRPRSSLVPAVRVVLPRRRGTARGAGRRGGPRHGVPVGAAFHPAAGPGRSALPARLRGPLVRGWTYLNVGGQWRYVYRAADQFGQVIDVYVSPRRDAEAARRFFHRAALSTTVVTPAEVTTDEAPAYPRVFDELAPQALHCTERYANNPIEADHGQLKRRLRSMRGVKTGARRPGRDRRTCVRAEHSPRPRRACGR
jgi:IS1 family transposase